MEVVRRKLYLVVVGNGLRIPNPVLQLVIGVQSENEVKHVAVVLFTFINIL